MQQEIRDSVQQDQEPFFPEALGKIRPMPVVYAHLQQKEADSQFNKAFYQKGYKHLSKLIAVGHLTDQNLKRIIKSPLKMVRSVEFDPYLCDSSGLKELARVLTKLRTNITNLNLRIRRTESSKEVDNVTFCLSRLLRLTKLRLELASSLSISKESLGMMGKRLKRCYILKSIEVRLVHINNAGQNNYRDLAVSYEKLLKLEELRHSIYTNHTPQNEFKDIPNKSPNLRRVKRLFLRTSAKTGWTSLTGGSGQFFPVYIRSFAEGMNPIYFTHILTNMAISTEAIEEYAKMIPKLLELKHLFLELSYCQLGDLELMILAEGFTHCKQVEHLTFKFIERTSMSFECICQFVQIIADLCSFSSFDLFFRKLECSPYERPIIEKTLSKVGNIEFVITKQSLHAFKKKKD